MACPITYTAATKKEDRRNHRAKNNVRICYAGRP